jgi:hypothetical protein
MSTVKKPVGTMVLASGADGLRTTARSSPGSAGARRHAESSTPSTPHLVAELDEFCVDAPVTPRRVVLVEAKSEPADLASGAGPAGSAHRLGPVAGHEAAVPAETVSGLTMRSTSPMRAPSPPDQGRRLSGTFRAPLGDAPSSGERAEADPHGGYRREEHGIALAPGEEQHQPTSRRRCAERDLPGERCLPSGAAPG